MHRFTESVLGAICTLPPSPSYIPLPLISTADSTCETAYQSVEIHRSLSVILVNPRDVVPSNETIAAANIRPAALSCIMGITDVING
jgi:hypothetical protein